MSHQGRMDVALDDARGIAAAEMRGRVESIEEDARLGWIVELTGIVPYSSSLLEDAEFDYCLLETQNDDEVGVFREVVMLRRAPNQERAGIIVEGVYQRPLGDNRSEADASFHGRMATCGDDGWEECRILAENLFADRILAETATIVSYMSYNLRTAAWHRKGSASPDVLATLASTIADMQRTLLDLGVADAGAGASA